ncbi:hypothetical protein HN51_014356 [Arachis hypogaea]
MQRQRHSPDDRPPLEVHGLGLVPSKCRRRRTSSQLAFPPKSIVIGYDEGTIMVKRGREVPVANMDNSGKIF